MSIEQRRFIRFSLDIPAYRYKSSGEIVKIFVRQISIGGCLAEWDDSLFIGDQFRMELELPNKNRLPLLCKILYKFPGKGVGVRFLDVTQFEQELLGQIISQSLEDDGMPLVVDPFAIPLTYIAALDHDEAEPIRRKRREEELAEEIMSQDT